jgi:ABC-type multidrug transport system fused ATPase/permease subunit
MIRTHQIKNQYLKELLYLLGSDKKKILFIIPLFIFSSVLDIIGIGLIVPYVSVIVNPESITNDNYKMIIDFFSLPSKGDDLLIIISVVLLLVFLFKTIFIIIINWIIFSFGYEQQVRVRALLMKSYQNLPYDKFLHRNSSEYILATVEEGWKRLEGTWVDTKNDIEEQKKFWSVLNNHRYFSRYHGYIHDDAKMSSIFLRNNANFLQ